MITKRSGCPPIKDPPASPRTLAKLESLYFELENNPHWLERALLFTWPALHVVFVIGLCVAFAAH